MKATTLVIGTWLLCSIGFMQEHYRHIDALADVQARASRAQAELEEVRKVLLEHNIIYVKVSAYTPSEDECDSDPYITSSGTRSKPGVSAAVSRDLQHLKGKRVYVPGAGLRVIDDFMPPQWSNKMDIMVATKAEAKAWGVRSKRVLILE